MKPRHSLTGYTVLLALGGLTLNILFAKLAIFLSLPLYLDSIGTILVSALGGYLPGIAVGFLSNVINGLSDPITLYYAIINIAIACAAAFFSRKGWFDKPLKAAVTVLVFAFIGGGLGSGLTWLLYGFSFGSGISAPLALHIHETVGISEFYAQLLADFELDVIDKIITVALCYFTIRAVPPKAKAALGSAPPISEPAVPEPKQRINYVRHSLRVKVVLIIASSAVILGSTAVFIGYMLYTDTMTDHYESTVTSVANMEASLLEGDKINGYLDSRVKDEDYFFREAGLERLRLTVPDIEYIYVYQIREDGCHVVFDVDTPDTPGGELGDIIPVEEDFAPYFDALLKGDSIPVITSHGAYGWLLTAYTPVHDSRGNTVAYAAADISMENVMTDRLVFIIRMSALLFGVAIVFIAFALWFAERRLVDPINAMAEAADRFAYDDENERQSSTESIKALNITTGDEIENLYDALKKTVTDVAEYINDISKKNNIIAQLQHNIIISFANMVENRDNNTGQHIKRTAAYVEVIAGELYKERQFPDVINPKYIASIVQSAPLHDLGKIEVPDAILNKPGKLTDEEFEQIKAHTTAGREILLGIMDNSEDSGYLAEAVNMAYSHHEWWNGKGYPQGLSGEEIPLSARIMAVADVYDALISKRSYKDAMDRQKAVDIIISESGTHFDPVVTEAFLNAREAIDDVIA